VKFFRDFFDDYFDDPLRHLRFFGSARSLLDEDDLFAIAGRAFIDVHEQAASRAGKPRWADKNPENVLYTDAWHRLLGDEWLFVHVVRNPLDTVASVAEAHFPLSVPAGLEARIDLYLAYTQAGLQFGSEHPERYQCVVYEELTADPGRVVTDLMRHLGEDSEPVQLAFNDVAHQPGLEDPKIAHTHAVHGASVNRWQSVLGYEDAMRVWISAAPLWSRIDPGHRHVAPPAPLPV
jgi:hypothetical protein